MNSSVAFTSYLGINPNLWFDVQRIVGIRMMTCQAARLGRECDVRAIEVS